MSCGSRGGHQRGRAENIRGVGIRPAVEQEFHGATVPSLSRGQNERGVAHAGTGFDIGPLGHQQAGLRPRKSRARISAVAPAWLVAFTSAPALSRSSSMAASAVNAAAIKGVLPSSSRAFTGARFANCALTAGVISTADSLKESGCGHRRLISQNLGAGHPSDQCDAEHYCCGQPAVCFCPTGKLTGRFHSQLVRSGSGFSLLHA